MKYLKIAEDPKIILYTREGGIYELESEEIERPEKEKLDKITIEREDGKAVFEDKVRISPEEKVFVSKAELYYSGKKVADRTFPEIMLDGDTLEFTWKLELERGGLPYIDELMDKADIPKKKSDEETRGIASEVYANNPDVVKDYRQGRESALNNLVGQVMDKSDGSADPEIAFKHLKKLIEV